MKSNLLFAKRGWLALLVLVVFGSVAARAQFPPGGFGGFGGQSSGSSSRSRTTVGH